MTIKVLNNLGDAPANLPSKMVVGCLLDLCNLREDREIREIRDLRAKPEEFEDFGL